MNNKILDYSLEFICSMFSGIFISVGMLIIGYILYLQLYTQVIPLNTTELVILIIASIGGLGMFLSVLYNCYCEIKELIKIWQK